MKSNTTLMQEARAALRGRWDAVVGYHVLSIIINGLVGGLFLVMAPIELGLSAIYLKSARKKDIKFSDFISGFTKGYWKSIVLVVLTGLIIFVMAVLLSGMIAVVAAATGWFSYEFGLLNRIELAQSQWQNQGFLAAIISVVVIPVILIWVAYIIVGIALSQSAYIWVDDTKLGVRDTLKQSVRLMKGSKWQYFCLGWRFVGWGILSVLFTFGIGFLWLIPYMRVTQARFYDDIVLEYNKIQAGVQDVKSRPINVVEPKQRLAKSYTSPQDVSVKIPSIYKKP